MKKTIHKIKQQPFHIREIVVWVSSLTIFAIIGIFWFTDFQDHTYALLNPQEVENQDTAVAEKDETSPFASLLSSFGGLKANISEFISDLKKDTNEDIERERIPQNLPLSE
jgi:hypothetical protein